MNKSTQVFILVIFIVGNIVNVYAGEKKAFSEKQICKVGIAKIMGKNPSIVKVDRAKGKTVYLSYIRQNDKTKWEYKCKIEGNRIIWGTKDGRWRKHPMDSKVTFKVMGNSITVTDTFNDSSASKETYTLE